MVAVTVPLRSIRAVPQRARLLAYITPAIYDTSHRVPTPQMSADIAPLRLPPRPGSLFLHWPGATDLGKKDCHDRTDRLEEHADSAIMPTPFRKQRLEGAGCALSRHNQRLSRKANRRSQGRYRPALIPRGAVRKRAFSFKRMSAWRYIFVVSADSCPSQSAITVRSTPW